LRIVVTLATTERQNSKRRSYLLEVIQLQFDISVTLFDVICREIKNTNVAIGVMKICYFTWKICNDQKKKKKKDVRKICLVVFIFKPTLPVSYLTALIIIPRSIHVILRIIPVP